MLGVPERGVGRLRICERTRVLLLEISAVPRCSPTPPPPMGGRPTAPWGFHRFAGEYTFLEKRFVAELTPPRPHAAPPQDFTSQPHPLRAPPALSTPVEQQHGPTRDQHPPAPPRTPLTGARPGPPSYETHMRRVRAAHLRRGGPPPYISPPAYDAPHRTLQPPLPRRPRGPLPTPHGRGSVPGGCSHTLPRAATEGGSRWPRGGMQPPPGVAGPPRQCQTLPRAAAPRERPVGRSGGRRGPGGHVLIDATRVVVRAQYVPPPQRHRVRYSGGVPVPVTPPRTPPAPHGAPTPPSALSPPRCPKQSPGKGGGARGRVPPPRRSALYTQALREAVSRIRRHTAPDSDSDAEGGGSGGGSGGGWQRHCRDVSAYSSSSSMESVGGPPPPGTASPIRA